MTVRYISLADFSYSPAEEHAVAQAMTERRPWDSELVEDIKKKIKAFHLELTQQACCYCYRNLHGEFSMVIDVEHILPKRHYGSLTFKIGNLSVACKRCNMLVKKDNLDFLNKPVSAADYADTDKFRFVHPNLDTRLDHLDRLSVEARGKRIVKYTVRQDSPKGRFAYTYFRLAELEMDSFDRAQGADIPTPAGEGAAMDELRAAVAALAADR